MHRKSAVASIIAATFVLAACGGDSLDAVRVAAPLDEPKMLVDLQALPEGHPPVPGFNSPPALPEGHPRCPARGSLETPPSDAALDRAQHNPPELVST